MMKKNPQREYMIWQQSSTGEHKLLHIFRCHYKNEIDLMTTLNKRRILGLCKKKKHWLFKWCIQIQRSCKCHYAVYSDKQGKLQHDPNQDIRQYFGSSRSELHALVASPFYIAPEVLAGG